MHSRSSKPVKHPTSDEAGKFFAHAQMSFPKLLFVFPPVERLAKTKNFWKSLLILTANQLAECVATDNVTKRYF